MSLVKKILSREDNLLAIGIAWTIGLTWFTVGGFYMGTIAGSKHIIDLQVHDMQGPGRTGAMIGFVLGVIVALTITFAYPNMKSPDTDHSDH